MTAVDEREREFEALYQRAHEAGDAAASAAQPTPVIFGSAKDVFSDEIDHSKPTYFEPEGVYGFAWVIVRPRNSSFANWLKRNGYGKHDSYYGGVTVWVGAYGQSMARKEAYAEAFATTLREAGLQAHSYSRMD